MRIFLVFAFCLAGPAASALSPAPPWYEHPASAQDLAELDRMACAPRGTHLEAARLGSRFPEPQEQFRDLSGEVTCSAHGVSDSLIWRHLPLCTWKTDRWVCVEGHVAADFIVRGEWIRMDWYGASFSEQQVRKLAADIFGLGTAGGPRKSIARGPCNLARDPDYDGKYLTLACADKIFGIEEERRGQINRYSIFWSDRRR